MALVHKYRSIYTHTNTIRILMEEIGPHEYYKQLGLKNLQENKPLLMSCFYLESKMDGIHLCYKYPLAPCSIMVLDDRYENLPLEGWKLVRNDSF